MILKFQSGKESEVKFTKGDQNATALEIGVIEAKKEELSR
jgi:hypothetical protein